MPASRIMFLYWGRRGLTQFAIEAFNAALADPNLAATVSVSRQNERFEIFAGYGQSLFAVDTFSVSSGALTQVWRIPLLLRNLTARLRRDRIEAVVELMPHVWSPIMASAIRAAGARYVTIAHDADTHPGDYRTKIAKRLLDWAAMSSDQVLTLSAAVTERLLMNSHIPPDKIMTLFHPDLTYGPPLLRRPPTPGRPMRLLFMGRILPYKGLSLFLDTVETLRAQGHAVEIGVFGEGALGENKSRLAKLQAEIVNRWLSEAEIAQVLPRFHCMVLSHTEASQSGVAAMALGFGLPVVATPVGGLREQIRDGETGVLAARVDAPALATAIRSLLLDPVRYEMTCHAIARARGQRSMAEFIRQCADSVRV